MAADKRRYAGKGDVLVDDTLKYRHLWEQAGGVFVRHTSAASTIGRLREIGVLSGGGRSASRLETDRAASRVD